MMKKVAVLPYNEYEKMKYNNTASVQNSVPQIQHSQPLYEQLLPRTVQNPQSQFHHSQPQYMQILPHNALALQPLSLQQQQLHQQNPYIVNDSLSFQQPLSHSLYDPKVDQITNYEKKVYRILSSDINVNEKHILYQDAMQKLIDLKDLHLHAALCNPISDDANIPVSYTHLRAHETPEHLVCRLLLEK